VSSVVKTGKRALRPTKVHHSPSKMCEDGLRLPLLARNRHAAMSDLSLLSGEERKSHFKAVTSVDHPIQKSALSASLPVGAGTATMHPGVGAFALAPVNRTPRHESTDLAVWARTILERRYLRLLVSNRIGAN